jgi:N-acetylmuramoyl-L-alanine amidase
MRKINEILVHCSATPKGVAFDIHDIDRWHRDQGWTRVGYHWVCTLNGIWQQGRKEYEVGAHAYGYNKHSIGICYIGGMDIHNRVPKDTRTPMQKAALDAKIKELLAKYPTITKITGHRQYAAKACPSFPATLEYAHYLRPGHRPPPKPRPKPKPGSFCRWASDATDKWASRQEK